MSSITNVNSNSSVVNVGRTTPVSPGPQTADKSIPVVMASDQTAIPVAEQNKVQSEVALSLLGIPRAEVALGIFADVNTYDVNPSEWSLLPAYHTAGYGIQHRPTEAGALVEAPRNKVAVLTSKRFFRYQPGRVSAATFGIKSSVSIAHFSQNPAIRKFGIYDKYDGYYWETKNNGQEDNFCCVRRTQSVANSPISPYGIGGTGENATPLRGDNASQNVPATQLDDYRIVGRGASESEAVEGLLPSDRKILTESKFEIIDSAMAFAAAKYTSTATRTWGTATGNYYNDLRDAINFANGSAPDITAEQAEAKCRRDLEYWLDNYIEDLATGGIAHTSIQTTNFALSNGSNDWDATTVGLFPDIELFERPVHAAIKEIFGNGDEATAKLYQTSDSVGSPTGTLLGLSSTAADRLDDLTDIAVTAFAGSTFAVVDVTDLTSANFGTGVNAKNRYETFFDVKKNFWAYYVTVKQQDGTSITYDLTNVPGRSGSFTVEEIQYKCQRDIGYIIDGYKNDLVGGGDAETIYNAQMFLRGTGLSVYSQQLANGTLSEIERNTHLQYRILRDLKTFDNNQELDAYDKIDTLSDLIIANFGEENTKSMVTGERGFAGNLVVMRDGLLHIHAGVNDPSLLKPSKKTKAFLHNVDSDTSHAARVSANSATHASFKLVEGIVTYGQHVKISWSSAATDYTISSGRIYKDQVLTVSKIIGPKGNIFELKTADDGRIVALTAANLSTLGNVFIDTVCPFIFPKDYDIDNLVGYTSKIETTPGTINNGESNNDSQTGTQDARAFTLSRTVAFERGAIPKGAQFPYMYAQNDDLSSTTFYGDLEYAGFINTSLDPNLSGAQGQNVNTIRSQIDNVNFFPEYVNWVKNNVSPEYYGVYEYRVPRSRFSHDALNGIRSTGENAISTTNRGGTRNRVYSDLATGPSGTVRPGENYVVTEGVAEKQDSEYNFDFTKVTMLKIEFSWYGAVGALFLAYVPVGNGEARWVRVHHLRASNQLKIASLGNATLPITYTTYGGGGEYALGDGEQDVGEHGYGNLSHNLVKYGASYYIDGGDRGTVRLYSYNNEAGVLSKGKVFRQTSAAYVSDDNTLGDEVPSVVVSANDSDGSTIDPRFYMGATVKTGNSLNQNIRVIYADATKVYLSSPLQEASGTVTVDLLVDRAATVYGLETKKVIVSTRDRNAVRNRVQVYPTKLSSSNTSGSDASNVVRLRFKKTPTFQTLISPSSTTYLTSDYTVDNTNQPLPVNNSSYLQNGTSTYGWFRARVDAAQVTVFGRLYREGDLYYFELLQAVEGVVTLKGGSANIFLSDLRFDVTGKPLGFTASKTSGEIEGLSSLKIATDPVVPIPNTGTNVATIYLQSGTEQFDLASYFDYNKEYLSFPLTDIADSLYFAVDSDTLSTSDDDSLSLGVTWEEQ